MKILILGAGSIGRRHAANLCEMAPDAHVTAMDPREEPLSQLHPNAYRCIGDRLDDGYIEANGKPDALVICTPATDHLNALVAAERLRIPFFVEKPVTLSSSNPINWESTVPHLVACNMRFRPEVRRLMSSLQRAIVEPLSIEFWSDAPMAQWPGAGYASPVFEFCHEVDLLCEAMKAVRVPLGTTRKVTLAGSSLVIHAWAPSRDAAIECQVAINWASPISRGGRIRWDHVSVESYEWRAIPEDVNQMYVDEMTHFLRVVRGEEKSVNTLAQAREVVRICEQVEAVCAS